MISIREQRVVAPSPEETFDYVANFVTTAEWDPGIRSARRTDDGPLGVGSRFQVVARFAGREVPLEYVITAFERPARVVLAASSHRVDAIDTIDFRAGPEGATLVDYRADFTVKGLLKYLAPLLQPLFDRLGTKALDGLVDALGAPAPASS